MTNKINSGEIYRMFIREDPDTIIRRPNLRRFAKQANIDYIIGNTKWLIDKQAFINALNPKNIEKHDYIVPRIRTLKGCVNEWNKTHTKGKTNIDKHIIEKLLNEPDIFKYKYGYHTWLINYDQIEKKLKNIFYGHSNK